MKYWFYSEGNILGPYAPGELLTLPAFAQDSLVCLETSTGDKPDDWKPASQAEEIEEALSVGAGKSISSGYGGIGDLYALETGFSQVSTPVYESAFEQGYACENLLGTIDDILKTGDGGSAGEPEISAYSASGGLSATEWKSSFDYDQMDKFDVPLSKIQEDLELARWEKDLLQEKVRLKDLEDRKQRDRIEELEVRLKTVLDQGGAMEKEFEQLRQSSGGSVPEAAGPQNGRLEDLTEQAETVRKTEEINKDNSAELSCASSAGPKNTINEKDIRVLKNLRVSDEVKLERLGDSDDAAQAGNSITSRRLKSLGGSAKSQEGPGLLAEDEATSSQTGGGAPSIEPPPLATPEPKPETLSALNGGALSVDLPQGDAAQRPPLLPATTGNLESLPKSDGVIQDFTAETPKSEEPFKKTQINSGLPGHGGFPDHAGSVSQSFGGAVPEAFGPQNGQSFGGGETAFAVSPQSRTTPGRMTAPEATGTPESEARDRSEPQPVGKGVPEASAAEAIQDQAQKAPDSTPVKQQPVSVPDKMARITISGNGLKTEVESQVKPARKGGRLAFIAIIIIFGAIAAGGLGFFFLGDGLSFSEFSMLDFNSLKRAQKSIMPSQLEPQVSDKNAGQSTEVAVAGASDADSASVPQQVSVSGQQNGLPAAENAVKSVPENQSGGAQSPATAAEQSPEKTSAPLAVNEGVKTAIETVKNYKLSGGRGAIGGWFANSFLSGSSGAASEEWSATPLHGDILVVQYRLIRQKQDPLIYQFEVDGAKNDIIRGINNNAIELLDFSSGKTEQSAVYAPKPEGRVRKISAKKLSAKAKLVRKPGKSKGVPLLPLPDAPAAGLNNEDEDSAGFEDAQSDNGEKVEYIKAQESDEELF